MNLTIIFITARYKPHLMWFLESLRLQLQPQDKLTVVVVMSYIEGDHIREEQWHPQILVRFTRPKPTVWQGDSRLTKDNWWAASNSRNTGIALCQTDWIAFQDDRSVLLPGWLDAVREAMAGNYAVFGSYQKRTGMEVKAGVITHGGIVTGEDSRVAYVKEHRANNAPTPAPGAWAFGCTLALPLEWVLKVNGYDETCDGLSMEDVIFGMMLENNGYELKFDRRMAIVEDRTVDQLSKPMKREDKGVSPNDKSHALLAMLKDLKQARHNLNLREIRNTMLAGGKWPPPWGPTVDWYDQQPLAEM